MTSRPSTAPSTRSWRRSCAAPGYECLVCGEFLLRRPVAHACLECGTLLCEALEVPNPPSYDPAPQAG